MKKVVINTCFGGFYISDSVMQKYGITEEVDYCGDLDRSDPRLVKAVEELGNRAACDTEDGECRFHLSGTNLKVVEIPDDVEFFIDNYDGAETIRENHRTWS
jgi:hypothetical protein